ncbi:MAG: polysaccharide deacetylase family protein [Clostridiales bacterium]|jgi:peptidoglycan/xylan/chitin deacetylase (PgdA/CDA1 family)|nr:polysaccharide deacetylase family protein [Clostridiales bacterium]
MNLRVTAGRWAFFLLAALITAGCAARDAHGALFPPVAARGAVSEPGPETDEPAEAGLSTDEPADESLYHTISEYGEPEAIIDNSAPLHCYLLYPKIGIPDIDNVIAEWANNIYKDAKKEMAGLLANDSKIEGEINVQYNAYLVEDRYIGLEEVGFYSHSHLAHPIDFFKTFNIDLEGKKFIANDEILDFSRQAEVLGLLEGRLLELFPDTAGQLGDMDGSWLESIVLNHTGVDILLTRGMYLPSYLGSLKVQLTYEELGGAFILTSGKGSAPDLSEGALSPEDTFDPNRPAVALTFDDGPSRFTPRILDLLEEYGGTATFCVIGNRVKGFSDVVQRAVAQGSEVIGHSWDHKQLTNLSGESIESELVSTYDAILETAGTDLKLYRAPYGAINANVTAVSRKLGFSLVGWSVDTRDWKTRNADAVHKAIMSNKLDGQIILCHDVYESTVKAMERVIPELAAQGYQMMTVSKLLALSGAPLEAGTVYRHR